MRVFRGTHPIPTFGFVPWEGVSLVVARLSPTLLEGDCTCTVTPLLSIGRVGLVLATWDPEDPR